jgi:hypothetical protein
LRPSFCGWHRRWGGLLVARQADPARSETATEETSVDIPADDLARMSVHKTNGIPFSGPLSTHA